MKKTHKQMVTFTIPQRDYILEVASRLGVSFAEVVRQIVDKSKESGR